MAAFFISTRFFFSPLIRIFIMPLTFGGFLGLKTCNILTRATIMPVKEFYLFILHGWTESCKSFTMEKHPNTQKVKFYKVEYVHSLRGNCRMDGRCESQGIRRTLHHHMISKPSSLRIILVTPSTGQRILPVGRSSLGLW